MSSLARIGTIVLAAGYSRRFGSDKRLALLNGKPLLLHTLTSLAVIPGPKLVVASDDLPMEIQSAVRADAELLLLPRQTQNEHGLGMGDSLAAAIKSASKQQWQAALVALADMPGIRQDTIQSLIQALVERQQQGEPVVPVYEGGWGHPVGFQQAQFSQLSQLQGDQGGRAILKRCQPIEVQVDDPAVLSDIDTPDDLQQFLINSSVL
ncbi:nucleotidyltransferase family protein [Ketobacter sp.]|uniref:nucleotidyltransferase family protein n=1 Tax=Ketobacter sp. TaxID=2083498 RepID=UPI000F2C4A79|nr:nucleotidyltransferase family protein [Ketobacter sp.]RLT95673.1 MAG: nucleotidyltransferase family protein [Ketobacter sp.]